MTGPRTTRSTIAVLMVAATTLLAAGSANAASKTQFVFAVSKVKLESKTPAAVETEIRKQLDRQIKSNGRLMDEPPEGAPDPDTEPKKFTAYMKKRDMRAFKVNVEVTEYEMIVEPAPRSKRDKMVVVRIALRIFGETVPDRSMAFTGDGSATVKLGTGSKVRDRDREVANREAIELAIGDAVTTSIRKLDGKKKKKKRR